MPTELARIDTRQATGTVDADEGADDDDDEDDDDDVDADDDADLFRHATILIAYTRICCCNRYMKGRLEASDSVASIPYKFPNFVQNGLLDASGGTF